MLAPWLLTALYLAPLLSAVVIAFALPAGRPAELYRRVALALSWLPLIGGAYLVYAFTEAGWTADAGAAFSVSAPWFRVQLLEVRYTLFVDGLSLPLVCLTAFLALLAVARSPVEERAREYYALLLLAEGCFLGTFLAGDFFLFIVFWAAGLAPVALLIGLEGGAEREYAAGRFFLYGLAGSGALLLAGLWLGSLGTGPTLLLAALPGQAFQPSLAETVPAALAQAPPEVARLALPAWWGIFLGCGVRLPVWPLHTWLPEAQAALPAGAPLLVSGALLNTGAYGIFRLLLPLLPAQSYLMREALLALAAAGIVWGGFAALAQGDLRRLAAYLSVSQMGLALLGAAAAAALGAPEGGTPAVGAAQTAASGALYQLVAHGILMGGLLLAADGIRRRTGTDDLAALGGLGRAVPLLGGYFRWFALGALGLPGLAGFVPLLLVFSGALQVDARFAAAAAVGWLTAAAALFWTLRRVVDGPADSRWAKLADLSWGERLPLLLLGTLSVLLGIAPGLLLAAAGPYVERLAAVAAGAPAGR